MSSNPSSSPPLESDSNSSFSSGLSSNACDDHTCSTAKCVLCLHCSQQYCFVHFLKHNEQLSLNTSNFTLIIDQLEDQIKNLKVDESLRRVIHSLEQWRKNLIRTIEYVYDEKLASIKANYILLNNSLQQFQLEQTSQIQTLRTDLEQMKFIRSTYDQDMNKIQNTIKQLQTNLSEIQYDLHLKQGQIPNIYDSIECEIVWKRSRIDDNQTSTASEDDGDIHENSTNGSSTTTVASSTSYEHCLLSFFVGNESSDQMKKPSIIINSNNKKRRICTNCGKCYHPSSLQRHYRQCTHQSIFRQTKSSNDTTLKTVTNILNQP